MNWLDLPPLSTLRAFSAFCQAGNITLAGAELNVSHAAISQHIRALETHLGVGLVDRSGRALALTTEGEQLARALELGFGAIGTAVQDIKGADAHRPLHISCTSSFAASWLMPRLPDFRIKHPEINLMLDPSPKLVTLKPGGIDLAIRHGQGDWPGYDVELLLASPMVIVAAPGLLKTKGEITPADLADYPWLDELGTTEWSTWLEAHGVRPSAQSTRIQVPGNLLLDGVRSGQGVVVTVRHFVEEDLKSGRLVELYCETDDRGYHIVTRPGVLRPAARKFVQWLRRQ